MTKSCEGPAASGCSQCTLPLSAPLTHSPAAFGVPQAGQAALGHPTGPALVLVPLCEAALQSLLPAGALWGVPSWLSQGATCSRTSSSLSVTAVQAPGTSTGSHRSVQAGGSTVVTETSWALCWLSCTSFYLPHLFVSFKHDLIAVREPPSPSSKGDNRSF